MTGSRLWVPALLAVIGLMAAGCGDSPGEQQVEVLSEQPAEITSEAAQMDTIPPKTDEVVAPESGSIVEITVVGVTGYGEGDLSGVVMREDSGLVVGGFATRITSDPFTTTAAVMEPGTPGSIEVAWPHLSNSPAALVPGEYALTLWTDTGLGGYTRWFPVNTDASGLAGCVHKFVVGSDRETEVIVIGDVSSTGYFGVCGTGGV